MSFVGGILVFLGINGHQVVNQTVDCARDSGSAVGGHGCILLALLLEPTDGLLLALLWKRCQVFNHCTVVLLLFGEFWRGNRAHATRPGVSGIDKPWLPTLGAAEGLLERGPGTFCSAVFRCTGKVLARGR